MLMRSRGIYRERVSMFGLALFGVAFLSCSRNALPASASEDASVNGWSDLLALFRSDIESCNELHAWIEEEGANLTCEARNTMFAMNLRYIPSAVRFCMASRDAFGKEQSPSAAIAQGRGTTQYILEVRRLPQPDGQVPEALRLIESDVFQVFGQDTARCAFIHHEPSVPSMPIQRIVLGFDRAEDTQDRQVVLLDRDGKRGGAIILSFNSGVFELYHQTRVDSTLIKWDT